ncbi:MAG: hypothetical protein ABJE66_37100 [Deltaproteobacteria bacterium]
MRSLILLGLTVALSAPAGAFAGAGGVASGVSVTQPADQAMTEGEVIVDGDPAALYALAQDYAKWTQIMPDVAKVEIHEQKGVDAKVTLVAPNGHRDNLHFHNQPQANLIFFEDTGNRGRADVWGEIVFAPAAQPAQTRVHIRLYAKVHGVATLVVSEREVRDQREHKLTADLTQMREYFRRRVADR